MKNKHWYRYRPAVDPLEDRQLLAAALTATLLAGTLRIEGTEADDLITVRQFLQDIITEAAPEGAVAPPSSTPYLSVDGTAILLGGTAVSSVPLSFVQRIEVFALGGNDRVVLGAKS